MLIEAKELTKSVKGNIILNNINFSVEHPCVIGLLGSNGAGKSSLMKILTGLTKRNSGTVSLFNEDPWGNWKNVYKKIGVLFEPKIPKYLNNYEYLKEICILRDINFNRIDETLKLVGLEKSKKKVKDYSFGMSQRLGLAGALIVEPKVLILDEPFVGLDPNGIKELQTTLKNLSRNGILILISSHQLSELKDLVDRILFLEKGNLKLDCPVSELSRENGFRIITSNNKEALNLLVNQKYVAEIKENAIEIEMGKNDSVDKLIASLGTANISLSHIEPTNNTLENLFK